MGAVHGPSQRFFALPSTAEGVRALMLFAVAATCVALGIGIAGLWFGLLEPEGGDQESPVWWLMVPMFIAAVVAIFATLAAGYFTFRAIRQGDRSALLLLPSAAFLIALTFFVGEFAVPH